MSKRICTLIALLMLAVSLIGGPGCNRGGKAVVQVDTGAEPVKAEPEKPQDLIIGKWEGIEEEKNMPLGLEFFKDGAVHAHSRFGPKGPPYISPGRYQLLNDNVFDLEFGFKKRAGEKKEDKAEVTKDALTITMKGKKPMKLKRVQEFSTELTALLEREEKPLPKREEKKTEGIIQIQEVRLGKAIDYGPADQTAEGIIKVERTGYNGSIRIHFEVDSKEGRVEVPKEVVIPAGSNTCTFTIKARANSSFGLTAIAEADGIAKTRKTVNLDLGIPKPVFVSIRGHSNESRVQALAFSPDGKRLASGSGDKTVKVSDAKTGKVILTLNGHAGSVGSVAFSPDGKRIASGNDDKTVKVWDASDGKELLTLKGHTAWVQSVAWSADGKRLASVCNDPPVVRVWDAVSGKEVLTLKVIQKDRIDDVKEKDKDEKKERDRDRPKEDEERLYTVCFSPDGKQLATAGSNGAIRIWDAARGEVIRSIPVSSSFVYSIFFSPDGKRLASADGEAVKVWNADTGKELLSLRERTRDVVSISYSLDGKFIAGGTSWDNDARAIRVWDATSGKEVSTLQGAYTPVCFSPDGNYLASATAFEAVIWRWQPGSHSVPTGDRKPATPPKDEDKKTDEPKDKPKDIDKKEEEKKASVEDSSSLTLKGHTGGVSSVAFSPDGKRIVSASRDKTVKVWDATTGKETLTLKGHTEIVTSVAFSPDGKSVVSGSFDQSVKVWNATTGKEALTLQRHTGGVNSVAFSPDGKSIVSGSSDQMVKVWDATTGKEMLSFKGDSKSVTSVAFSPDGKRIVSGSWDQTVKVWDATTGKEIVTLNEHTKTVKSVAFSPDGKRIISGSWDGTVKVWDTTTGKKTLTLHGHTAPVNGVVFGPDGNSIASGSSDQTVKVWDASTGKELMTLKGHTEIVDSVAFSPDGKRIVSGSETAKVWTLPASQPAELAPPPHPATTIEDVIAAPGKFEGKSLSFEKIELSGKLYKAPNPQRLGLAFKTPAGTDISDKGSDKVFFVVSKDYGAEIAKKMDEAKTYPVNLTCSVEKAEKGKNWLVIVSKVEFRVSKDEPKEGTISLTPDSEEVEIRKEDEKGTEVKIRVERQGFAGEVKIVADSDTSELKVDPTTRTVKAGENEFRLTLYVGKDGIKDGKAKVKVTASAKGAKPTTATLTVIVK